LLLARQAELTEPRKRCLGPSGNAKGYKRPSVAQDKDRIAHAQFRRPPLSDRLTPPVLPAAACKVLRRPCRRR